MVGREKTSKKIQKNLNSSNKYVTVEGLNGVGKTSVINVSIYDAAAQQIKNASGPLFIPCRKVFQLSSGKSADDFKFKVLAEVAQTLIEAKATLPIPNGHSKSPNNAALNRWLNSIDQRSAGIATPVRGLNFGQVSTTSEGFNKSGLEKAVKDWCQLIFPSTQEGAVVCIIDNLELLQTSKAAREQVEALRDAVLSLPGARWVLCGALGIIEGVAASPRMAGYLQKPIQISDLDPEHARELFRRRLEHFQKEPSAELPLDDNHFVFPFDTLKGNLRAVLSECDSFCLYASDLEDDGIEVTNNTFYDWFHAQSKEAYDTSVSFLGNRAFQVFETACAKETFSPSDHAEFGYDSMQAMRPQILALETAGLLVSTQDEADKRRRTVQVVAKGWKVKAYLDKQRIASQVE